METVTLTVEQLEELKEQIKQEIKEERKSGYNKPMVNVERKYHWQLVHINAGSTWNSIRTMTAYLLGCKRSIDIAVEKQEESAKIAEKLCIEVIQAFGGTPYDEKAN